MSRELRENLKISFITIMLFSLSYSFHPMNNIMREMLKADVHQMLLRLSVLDLLLVADHISIFVVLAMAIGFPWFFAAHSWNKQLFLKAGLLFGLVSAFVCALHFAAYEKDQMMRMAWFMTAPVFIAVYFLLGFILGGFWGIIGGRILR